MRCVLLMTACLHFFLIVGLGTDLPPEQGQTRPFEAVAQAVSMWKRLVGPYPPMQPRVGEAMVLAFAMSASAAFALAVLFLWHCYLILTAQVSNPAMPAACACLLQLNVNIAAESYFSKSAS